MTVDNDAVIDFVVHQPASDSVLLVLVEYRDWGSSGELLPELQRKIRTYLQYALGGQLTADYPQLQGKPIVFDLRTVHLPGPHELEFLEQCRKNALGPRGIQLSWKQTMTGAGASAGVEENHEAG